MGVRGKGRQSLAPLSNGETPERLLLALRFHAGLAHRVPAHLDAVGVVHDAIEDAVGQGRIADLLVPFRDGQLRGQIIDLVS
jgi:hypothetical protein